jgi:MFS family permease
MTSVMSLIIAIFMPLAGYLSDTYGRKLLLSIGIVGVSTLSILLFSTSSGGPSTIFLLICLAVTIALFYGGEAAFLSELFPTYIRYSAVSVTLSLANIFFGSITPLVSTLLSKGTSGLTALTASLPTE